MPIDKTFGRTVSIDIQAEQSALLPEYDELANAPAEAASIVLITGNGTEAAGVYAHTGAGWVGPFGEGGSDSSYTDEMAQNAVGAMSDATLAYDDTVPSLGIADGSVGPAKLDSTGDYAFGSAAADGLLLRDTASGN